MAEGTKGADRPTHVEEAIQAMTAMHNAHHAEASRLDRLIDRLTATAARPSFLIYVAAALALWIGANVLPLGLGFADSWPFPFLALLVSCTALFISVLILASQRRADRLANLRE